MAKVNLVMTRAKDDEKELWDLLGSDEYKKELDRQFKKPKSNFKIAIVVDMWLTGFDVPELDTMYLDKPVQQHSVVTADTNIKPRVHHIEIDLPNGDVVEFTDTEIKFIKDIMDYDEDGGEE